MNWVEVQLDIPDWVFEIYEIISSIQPQTSIAGGFLSDLYMGTSYKDVDFFIRSDEDLNDKIKKVLKSHSTKFKEFNFDSDYDHALIDEVTNLEINNKPIQLVFSKKGIRSVKYFDFRFREFVYINGKTFASKEALEDIKNKQLVFGVTPNPLNSLYRSFAFNKRYQFSFEDNSFDRLYSYINESKFNRRKINEFIEKKSLKEHLEKTERIARRFEEFLLKNLNKVGQLTFEVNYSNHHRRIPLINYIAISRDQADILSLKKEFYQQECALLFDQNPYLNLLQSISKSIKSEFETQSLRMLFRFPTKKRERWNRYLENLNKNIFPFLEAVSDEINHNNQMIFKNLFSKLMMYTSVLENHNAFSLKEEFILSDDIPLAIGVIPVSSVLKNNVIMIKPKNENSYLFVNKNTWEIYHSSLDDCFSEAIVDLMKKKQDDKTISYIFQKKVAS